MSQSSSGTHLEPARIAALDGPDRDPGLLDGIETPARLELLDSMLAAEPPSPRASIYVNRTLRMSTVQHLGFDLDWTLAHYDQDRMSQLAFERTLERLVERFDYPRSVLEAEFRADFCRRGLILDTTEGTVLKMNRHRYVGRAYHGRRFLDATERGALYRRTPIHPSSPRYYHVDTLFELPEVNIFSELIHLAETQPHRLQLPSYEQLFRDTRQAVDSIHADGTLKSEILADLDHFLPRDQQLVLALQRLALHGRRLILITNSEWFYTDGLCRQLFENWSSGVRSWREMFDLVIVSSCKPGFFKKKRAFTQLDDTGQPVGEVDVPQWGGVYSGGCREGLMQLLGTPGEQVLYVGDHIYGDVVSSKMSSTWRSALVVSELADEIAIRQERSAQLRHLGVLRAELAELGLQSDALHDVLVLANLLRERGLASEEPQNGDAELPDLEALDKRLREYRSEHKAMRKHAARLQSRVSKAINPYWGSLFKQGANKSLFGSQVDDFACIYTAAVRNFAFYGSDHYFRVTADAMMHEVEI